MDLVSCLHLATSPHPHNRQYLPLPSNRRNISLHVLFLVLLLAYVQLALLSLPEKLYRSHFYKPLTPLGIH